MLIHGAVRDVVALANLDLGLYALGSTPKKSVRRNEGQTQLSVTFGHVVYRPGEHIYIDADGVLVSPEPLL